MLIVRRISPDHAGYYWPDAVRHEFLGKGWAALTPPPELAPSALAALLDGVDPRTGELLGRRRRDRQAGWDLIFPAPKSVSLLAALAPPGPARAITGAHQAAVADAVGYLERH